MAGNTIGGINTGFTAAQTYQAYFQDLGLSHQFTGPIYNQLMGAPSPQGQNYISTFANDPNVPAGLDAGMNGLAKTDVPKGEKFLNLLKEGVSDPRFRDSVQQYLKEMRNRAGDSGGLKLLQKEALQDLGKKISTKMGGNMIKTGGSKFLGGLLKAIPGVGLVVGVVNLAVTYTRKNPPATKAEKALAWTGAIAGGLALIPGAGTVGATVLGGVAAVAGGTGLAISAHKHNKWKKEQVAQQEEKNIQTSSHRATVGDPAAIAGSGIDERIDPNTGQLKNANDELTQALAANLAVTRFPVG